MPSRAEAVAASITTAIAVAILCAYFPFRAGWTVSRSLPLVIALATGLALLWWLRRAHSPRVELRLWGSIVAGALALLLWMAWPSLLPIGGGPDLTHHLVLIDHIERAWNLVDDPALYPYLGDMMDYTPGSHLLIALAGAWSRTDGIHAAHAVVALTVALKIGFVFLVARRVAGTAAAAVAAVALLFMPLAYVIGSFVEHSYWAQVVAELFAVAAWWALVSWDEQPSSGWMILFALFGMTTFVAWPIWIGPVVLSAIVTLCLRDDVSRRTRALHMAMGIAPIAAVAIVHSIGKFGRLQMTGTSGFAIRPSIAIYGWPFAVASLAGLPLMATTRRGRATLAFLAATLIQAGALFVVARRSGADTPYLAQKMFYLTPYPLAIAGAFPIAWLARESSPWFRRVAVSWIVVGGLAGAAAYRFATFPRSKPIVAESTLAAGRWARDHVDRACVDYLVADSYTGYWLHLAVLDNPRDTPRFNDPSTFDPQKAIARWIETSGLPYAIVDDVNGFSTALFSGTETLAAFGPSRVIQRRGAAVCR